MLWKSDHNMPLYFHSLLSCYLVSFFHCIRPLKCWLRSPFLSRWISKYNWILLLLRKKRFYFLLQIHRNKSIQYCFCILNYFIIIRTSWYFFHTICKPEMSGWFIFGHPAGIFFLLLLLFIYYSYLLFYKYSLTFHLSYTIFKHLTCYQ